MQKTCCLVIIISCCQFESLEVCDAASPSSPKCWGCHVSLLFHFLDSFKSFAHFSAWMHFVQFSTQNSSVQYRCLWFNKPDDMTCAWWEFPEAVICESAILEVIQHLQQRNEKLFAEERGLSSPRVMWNLVAHKLLMPFNLPNPEHLQHQKRFFRSWWFHITTVIMTDHLEPKERLLYKASVRESFSTGLVD